MIRYPYYLSAVAAVAVAEHLEEARTHPFAPAPEHTILREQVRMDQLAQAEEELERTVPDLEVA